MLDFKDKFFKKGGQSYLIKGTALTVKKSAKYTHISR